VRAGSNGSDEPKSVKKSDTKRTSYKLANTSTTKEKKVYTKQSSEKVGKKEIIVSSLNVNNVSKGEVTKFTKTTAATPTLKKNK
jgi:hypothetical protein